MVHCSPMSKKGYYNIAWTKGYGSLFQTGHFYRHVEHIVNAVEQRVNCNTIYSIR